MLGVIRLSGKLIRGLGGQKSAELVFFFGARLGSCRVLRVCGAILFVLLGTAVRSNGQTWERLGPAGGNVISLVVAADGAVYIGTPDGHVFASRDRGEHWQLRGRAGDSSDGRFESHLDGVVQRIVADKMRPERLLAAVWFQDPAQGGGVFESTDGAQHWKLIGLGKEAVRALERSESDPRVWVAGTRTGTYRSTDDAHTWQRITAADNPELQNVDSLAVDPVNPEIIYLGTYHLAWKTTDGGKNWSSIATGMIDDSDIMSLRIDARNPRRVFSSACSGIYRSDDSGGSWTKLQGIPYASRRTQQIVQDPNDASILYAATTQGLWQTTDSGENWKRVTPRETVANAIVVLTAGNSTRILAGTEAQGILRSDDGASSFHDSNGGFSHRVIASIAAAPRDPSHFLARLEDSRGELFESRDGGTSWTKFSTAGLTKPVAELYGSSSGWWMSFADGGLAQFDSAKGKWRSVLFREAARHSPQAFGRAGARATARSAVRMRVLLPRVTAFVEFSGKILVGSEDGLWTGAVGDSEFHRPVVKSAVKGEMKSAAKSVPRSVQYLFSSQNSLLAIADNKLWASDSAALNWNFVSSPANVGPANTGRLLWIQENLRGSDSVRFLGTDHGVFLSVSSGAWQLLSSGLPAVASAPMANSGSLALVAMSNGGIYRSADSGKSWERVDTGGEQGSVAKILPAPNGVFVVASRSEGLLRLTGGNAAKTTTGP